MIGSEARCYMNPRKSPAADFATSGNSSRSTVRVKQQRGVGGVRHQGLIDSPRLIYILMKPLSRRILNIINHLR